MWSRINWASLYGWEPNHFVPLVQAGSKSTSGSVPSVTYKGVVCSRSIGLPGENSIFSLLIVIWRTRRHPFRQKAILIIQVILIWIVLREEKEMHLTQFLQRHQFLIIPKAVTRWCQVTMQTPDRKSFSTSLNESEANFTMCKCASMQERKSRSWQQQCYINVNKFCS